MLPFYGIATRIQFTHMYVPANGLFVSSKTTTATTAVAYKFRRLALIWHIKPYTRRDLIHINLKYFDDIHLLYAYIYQHYSVQPLKWLWRRVNSRMNRISHTTGVEIHYRMFTMHICASSNVGHIENWRNRLSCCLLFKCDIKQESQKKNIDPNFATRFNWSNVCEWKKKKKKWWNKWIKCLNNTIWMFKWIFWLSNWWLPFATVSNDNLCMKSGRKIKIRENRINII